MPIKVVLLAAWVGAMYLWLMRHFEYALSDGLFNIPGLSLAGLVMFAGVFSRIYAWISGDSVQERSQSALRQWLNKSLSYPALGLLYVLAFTLMLGLGTLTILPEKFGKSATLMVSPLLVGAQDRTQIHSVDGRLDLHFFVNPFASEYRVSLQGYLPEVIRIRPVFGTTLLPQRDLRPIPTVLLRPSLGSKRLLVNSGHLHVLRQNADGQFMLLRELAGASAWYSGPERTIPASLLEKWRLETIVRELTQNAAADMLLTWRSPKAVAENISLLPGETICLLITNKDQKKYFAGALHLVSQVAYQDVYIEDFDDGQLQQPENSLDADRVCHQLMQRAGLP
ncbi:hypothetical protein P2G88_01350 [Aliiglaciecola sp. CAU 1673]|uniref:hypothetical protein n=1 Tax=Aliiglaciecola sp. CAU 1673 TaxID=3032595 RepID=UPI0023DC4874|nr:hypothetical protein [Aliiglaciecola sp. CAU 1673]MDF2176897.1 hypothetical protein [Aliiglaciecola sp. CAU 1673]